MSSHIPEGFKPITLQRIFDLAWQAFIVENLPPSVEGGSCAYLTLDGKSCVVGLALPPNRPDGKSWRFSHGSFANLVATWPSLFDPSVRDREVSSLNDFQRLLHDDLCTEPPPDYEVRERWVVPLEERRKRYLEVARMYGLKVPS